MDLDGFRNNREKTVKGFNKGLRWNNLILFSTHMVMRDRQGT